MKLQECTDGDRSMLDITVTSTGIEKLLSNINPHKAVGPDQIKPIILKNLSTPLPPIWKDANVAPVYDKGGRFNPANYRLVFFTCILCKTLEHIVASSITKHLSGLNIVYEL